MDLALTAVFGYGLSSAHLSQWVGLGGGGFSLPMELLPVTRRLLVDRWVTAGTGYAEKIASPAIPSYKALWRSMHIERKL